MGGGVFVRRWLGGGVELFDSIDLLRVNHSETV